MATFTYRCPSHRFDATFPIGTAPPDTRCPTCGTDAVRVFTPPRLSLAPRQLMAALDRSERSRTEPDVVSAVPSAPGRARRSAPAHPALRRLPRP